MLTRKDKIISTLGRVLLFVGTPLIVFAAARNTITWHFQQFWGASANFWQLQWDRVLDITGDDHYILWAYGSFAVTFFVFWVVGSVYTLVDLTNKPTVLMRYKTQPGVNEPVDPKKVLKILPYVFINTTLFTLPISYLTAVIMEWRGCPNPNELPTFHWVLFELAVLIIMEEIGFYYTHRILHCSLLYKFVHKKHHEWTAPIALTALYSHPIEHIFSNLLPMCLGLYVMGTHVATTFLWFTIGILATLHSHCGYHLPFIPSNEFHDYHHLKFNQCFGVLGLMDRIHGTDVNFRKTIHSSRHVLTLNLTSAREMFPDPVAKQQKGK